MADVSSFDGAAFLGPARESKRDPYRLSLFAEHLVEGERPIALLPIHSGTLLVTDHRLLVLRAHLDVHGAWNVKAFHGYEIRDEVPRASVLEVAHRVDPDPTGTHDVILLRTAAGLKEVLVSRGPRATLSDEDFLLLRDAILAPQRK
ncbi:MAG TPA: hypothetical protein VIB49_04070 [Thermoplasmata archaeon]|jgi:hypothetical protein